MNYPLDFAPSSRKTVNESLLKLEHKSWLKLMSDELDDYCQQGSLHGLKYIRDPSLPRTERIFWFIVFSVSLSTSAMVTWKLYQNGFDNQIEMSFDPISTPVWDVPFPSIEVCSAYPVRKSVFDLDKNVNSSRNLHFSALVCPTLGKKRDEKIKQHEFIGDDFFKFIRSAAIPCENLLIKCVWKGKETDCCTLFKPIIAENGQCYIFNMYPGHAMYSEFEEPIGEKEDWNERMQLWEVEAGYPNRSGNLWKHVYPEWADSSGEHNGLTVDLEDNRSEWQRSCSGAASGFRLKILAPYDSPEIITNLKLGTSLHTHVRLEPTFIVAKPEVRTVPLDVRRCAFNGEIQLKYFKLYSQSNCITECFIQYTLKNCGCVPAFFQRFVGPLQFEYCNYQNATCINEATNLVNKIVKSPDNCSGCVPHCSDLSYNFISSSMPLHLMSGHLGEDNHVTEKASVSRISFYFEDQQFHTILRSKKFSLHSFLGNCGGLLGLLLGFSLMSAVEVLYFAFIRPLNKLVGLLFTKSG